MQRKREMGKACAQFCTGIDIIEGGGKGMVITEVKIFIQRLGRVTIRFVERDRGFSTTKLNSKVDTI